MVKSTVVAISPRLREVYGMVIEPDPTDHAQIPFCEPPSRNRQRDIQKHRVKVISVT